MFVNTPADPMLDQILQGTAFELGGYVNVSTVKLFKVTYLFDQGRLWLERPTTATPEG